QNLMAAVCKNTRQAKSKTAVGANDCDSHTEKPPVKIVWITNKKHGIRRCFNIIFQEEMVVNNKMQRSLCHFFCHKVNFPIDKRDKND
ncbi:MAG: hypothetical protein IJ508_04140, partial [Oscillospiraceae bacterium]|nr:hypothetical protein [Oscillospiraceae bacterium]